MSDGKNENAELLEAAGNDASIMALIRQAKEGVETHFDLIHSLDENGDTTGAKTLTISRRQLQPELAPPPRRAESPRRNHTLHSAESLKDYLTLYATDQCVVMADVNQEIIRAVLDETAENGKEIIYMKPAIHPKLAPWLEIIDKVVPVHKLATFIMQNRRTIISPDPREMAVLFHNLRMSKAITVYDGKGARAVNGISIETTIQGKKENQFVELPQSIKLYTPIYVGTDPVEFEIDLLVHAQTEEGKAAVDITSSELTTARVEAFEQMLQSLKNVRENVVTGFGVLDSADWRYLPNG